MKRLAYPRAPLTIAQALANDAAGMRAALERDGFRPTTAVCSFAFCAAIIGRGSARELFRRRGLEPGDAIVLNADPDE